MLCHDDQLEDRQIAFIFYLTNSDWDCSKDGGALELFNANEKKECKNVVRKLNPSRNSFSFFEVSPVSFHQVGEVLRREGGRLSINGWFNAPKGSKAIEKTKAVKQTIVSPWSGMPPSDIDEEDFMQWLSPDYFDPNVLGQIQSHLNDYLEKGQHGDICLAKLLQNDKLNELVNTLNELANTKFTRQGPPMTRWVKTLPIQLENVQNPTNEVEKFIFFLTSDAFLLILSQMTGLEWLNTTESGEVCYDIEQIEVRLWSAGDYSVLLDSDEQMKPGSLAFHYFAMPSLKRNSLLKNNDVKMRSQGANPGCVVYAQPGVKEPAVVVEPVQNSLAIVMANEGEEKEGLVCFNRYMNRAIFGDQRFFEFYVSISPKYN